MKLSNILLGAAMIVAAPIINEVKAQVPATSESVTIEHPMVHDPVMAYENGKYYLYCTGHGVAQMTSTDRQHWTLNPQGVLKDEARGAFPAWTHDSVPGYESHTWAPDVIRYKDNLKSATIIQYTIKGRFMSR